MKAINCACLRLEEKATRSVKMNKNYFINIIGDKCIECTKRVKLTASFCNFSVA